MKTDEFRRHLQNELILRCKRNPRYSLRAFAQQLEIDASALSKILNGKRPIGRKTILQLGSRLGMKPDELKRYTGTPDEQDAEDTFEQLALDQFAIISDWYHFAILELMATDRFNPDPKSIARTLGLKLVEVNAAISRLKRVGLLEISNDGIWKDKSSGFSTNLGSDILSGAHRLMQEQFLTKALEALRSTPIELRDHSTMTVAIDTKKLPEARERMKKFRRSLAKFLADGDSKTAVYNLNLALFPLTQTERTNL
jgi:plasmid maintenance system antidote protein VapI